MNLTPRKETPKGFPTEQIRPPESHPAERNPERIPDLREETSKGGKKPLTGKALETDERKIVEKASPGGGMVDALVSGASAERRAGSTPVLGTDKAT